MSSPDQEMLLALIELVNELQDYDVPQVDDDGNFGPTTALHRADKEMKLGIERLFPLPGQGETP